MDWQTTAAQKRIAVADKLVRVYGDMRWLNDSGSSRVFYGNRLALLGALSICHGAWFWFGVRFPTAGSF